MDKISGIIPNSPRITAVDLKESSAVRPGAPSFGRAEGISSLRDPMRQEAVQKATMAQQELNDWRSKDARQAAVAQSVTDKFFIRNRVNSETESPRPPIDDMSRVSVSSLGISPLSTKSAPAGFKTDEVGNFRAASRPGPSFDMMDTESEELMQPDGLYPKGSFIDRTV